MAVTCESMKRPVTIGIDAHGGTLYGDLTAQANARLPAIMAERARERALAPGNG